LDHLPQIVAVLFQGLHPRWSPRSGGIALTVVLSFLAGLALLSRLRGCG